MHVPASTPYVNPLRNFALYAAAKSGNTILRDWFMTNLGAYSLRQVVFRIPSPYGRRFLGAMIRRRKLAVRIWVKASRTNSDLRILSDVYRDTVSRAIIDTDQFQNMVKIIVVRDPTSRIISAYLDKFCGEDRQKEWVNDVVRQSGNTDGISFNQFLDFLLKADPATLNRHWCPQSTLFEGVRFDHVIKLEQLAKGFKEIEPIVGTRGSEVLDRQRQVQNYRKDWEGTSEDLVNTPSHFLVQRRKLGHGVPPKNKLLTAETRTKIEQVYRGDFDRFAYSPP